MSQAQVASLAWLWLKPQLLYESIENLILVVKCSYTAICHGAHATGVKTKKRGGDLSCWHATDVNQGVLLLLALQQI